MDVGAPCSAGLDLVLLGDVVAVADGGVAVEAGVGLLVVEAGSERVGGDMGGLAGG